MKFLNFNRVLCLAPHPDDAEYSLAGLVMKYPDTEFHILCLTQGGSCDTTTSEARLQEVRDAWKCADAANYSLYFTQTRTLRDLSVEEWINYIETNYTQTYLYDCIMTPSEYDSHHEHVTVSTFAAPLARVEPYSIIQYRSPSTLETWIPNLFVTVDETYDTKKHMLTKFTSQNSKIYFLNSVLDGFHTNYQCMKKGKGYVESYKIITCYE